MSKKKTSNLSIAPEKRMLSEKEAGVYMGLGRTKTRETGKKIKAVVHIGKRVLYDKTIIDEFIDNARKEKAQ